MFAYKRLAQLFQRFYLDEYCSSEALASDFSVSKRTIRNDINELNDLLKAYQAKIVFKKGHGYQLLAKDRVQHLFSLAQSQSPFTTPELESPEDRIKKLLLLLLVAKRPLTIEELSQQVFVGRTTLLGYIRQLRLLLAPYNLKIVSKTNIGYQVLGAEAAIREAISDQLIEKNFESYISQFSRSEHELFKGIDLTRLAELVTRFFPPDHYNISDYNRKNFIIHLAIAILRLQDGHQLVGISQGVMVDDELQKATSKLLDVIAAAYQITFSQQDQAWLTKHLLSDLQHEPHSSHQIDKIYAFIDQMLTEIYEIIGEDLKHDETLRHDLFVHFSSYLTLKELVKNKKNPLLSEIKKNYSYAFELAVLATNNSRWLNEFDFTEDDIGYLALHIAAAIERKKDQQQRKRILLVCGQGISTSRLVEAMLKKRFSDKIDIVDTISYAAYQTQKLDQIDLLISTVPLTDKRIPVVQIDFMDIKHGMEKLNKLLNVADEKKDFLSLFDASLFAVNDQVLSRDELILSLGTILQEQGIVADGFTQKVIQREQIAPTNITKLIAIPHAIDAAIKETKIFVYISTTPIKWQAEATVKIVFLLAVVENDKGKLQKFFESLSDLVEDEKLQQKIADTKNFEDFLATILP